jgi:hypothetical protein
MIKHFFSQLFRGEEASPRLLGENLVQGEPRVQREPRPRKRMGWIFPMVAHP